MDKEINLFIIIDGNTYTCDDTPLIEKAYRTIVVFREKSTIPKSLEKWLGKTTLVDRKATQLKSVNRFYYAQFFDRPGYYFAEEPSDRNVIKCAFDGGILEKGKVYYEAAAVDWSLFNESPEAAKCAAICLYEALEKPSGVAAAGLKTPRNELLATTIDVIPESPRNIALWKMLLYDVEFAEPATDRPGEPARKKEHDLLLDGPVSQ